MRFVLATVAALLLLASAAHAATYTVNACTGGGGSGVNRLFARSGDASAGCVPGNGLFAHSYPPLAPYVASRQTMTAPAGTTIAGYWMGWSVNWSTPINGGYNAFVDGDGGAHLTLPCTFAGCGGLPPSGPATTGWQEATRHGLATRTLHLGTLCGGSPCTSGYAEGSWSDIYVDLTDTSAPAVTTGSLDGWSTGTRTVSYAASDNSGIRRTRLYVDGALRSDDMRACDWSYAVPCRDVSGSFAIDATKLADGAHTFELRALDATDANAGTSGAVAFRADNNGPALSAGGQGAPGTWQPGPVRVTLRARDEFSGVAWLEWALDGGALRRVPADSAEVDVAGDGTHTITYRARDAAGNLSGDRTITVGVGTPSDRPPAQQPGFSDRATNGTSTFSAAASF
jgi:hypothetical protein